MIGRLDGSIGRLIGWSWWASYRGVVVEHLASMKRSVGLDVVLLQSIDACERERYLGL